MEPVLHAPATPEKPGKPSYFTWFAASYAVLFLFLLPFGGCSPQSNRPPKESTRRDVLPEDRTFALARDNDCAVLSEQITKLVGTNPVYSIDIQRVLATNKRIAATCYLIDLIQTREHPQAIFQIDDLELGAWYGTCVARLECPTNLIPTLASEQILSEWAVAFELTSNGHDLQFSKGSNDNPYMKIWGVLTIEGKLLGVRKGSF